MNFVSLQSIRVSILVVLLFGQLSLQMITKYFYSPSLEVPFLLACGFVFLIHFVFFLLENQKLGEANILFSLFFVDTCFFLFGLHLYPGSIAVFVLLLAVNIVLAGLSVGTNRALLLVTWTAVGFNLELILNTESQGQPFLFAVVFNTFVFYALALISGQFSERILALGAEVGVQQLKLSKALSLNEVAFDSVPGALLVVDQKLRLVQWNGFAAQFFKLASLHRNELVYRSLPWLKDVSLFKKNQEISLKKDSKEVVLSVSASELVPPASGFVVLATDITDIRIMEKRLRQNEKLAAVGQLAAGIAHEIRNPLASIGGSVEMLQSGSVSSEESTKLMKIVVKETHRLSELIEEFLEYVRPDRPVTEKINLTAVTREALEVVSLNKKISDGVIVDSDLSFDYFVLGDFNKLKQAFINILQNAFQALDSIDNPKLSIKAFEIIGTSTIQLEIIDNGCGMSEETLGRLFEPFHTTKPKGTGLGLAVTHKIIENHKAEILVQSELGKGSVFIIQFPKV